MTKAELIDKMAKVTPSERCSSYHYLFPFGAGGLEVLVANDPKRRKGIYETGRLHS